MANDRAVLRTNMVKHKPPSRIRYEQSHPTVSCRVTKEISDRLKEICETEDKSMADILNVGLKILKVKAEKELAAFQRDYQLGYRVAEDRFKVTYCCSVCGNPIELRSEKEKDAAAHCMEEQRWGHYECINNQK